MKLKTDLVLGIGFIVAGLIILALVAVTVFPQLSTEGYFGISNNSSNDVNDLNGGVSQLNSNLVQPNNMVVVENGNSVENNSLE